MKELKIVIVGAGVSGIHTATKLVDNGYPGDLITIIDKGKDPYNRKPEEVMTGFAGAGGFSDGKLVMSTNQGGHISKYCGEEKGMALLEEVYEVWKRFHPDPSKIMFSNATEEPSFIKPYFDLRLFGVYHIGTDYLHEIGKSWYDYLVEKGVNFEWETEVTHVNFKWDVKVPKGWYKNIGSVLIKNKQNKSEEIAFNKLVFGVGKSGIDLAKTLSEKYDLPTEEKPVQIGVRFEAPQHHFQNLIDMSYDFKLYKKYEDKGISLRSFCTNNNAAYVAVEETYGDHSYNGHAKKDEKYRNDMTNFGILMEIRGIDNPFDWSRNAVKKLQINGTGTYYSPSRKPSLTSEGNKVSAIQVDSLDKLYDAYGEYAQYIIDFIEDLKRVFPTLQDDWTIYMPEVKYLNPEVLVKYDDLSLVGYPDIHFAGDALSARGIVVSGAHGIYIAESILNKCKQ
jgi:uncharacterized FAD-dependent dehydrogenase